MAFRMDYLTEMHLLHSIYVGIGGFLLYTSTKGTSCIYSLTFGSHSDGHESASSKMHPRVNFYNPMMKLPLELAVPRIIIKVWVCIV